MFLRVLKTPETCAFWEKSPQKLLISNKFLEERIFSSRFIFNMTCFISRNHTKLLLTNGLLILKNSLTSPWIFIYSPEHDPCSMSMQLIDT